MVTSPQDHWMIKGSGFEIGGKKRDETNFRPIREVFVFSGENGVGSFLKESEKVSSRELTTMFCGEGKTVERWLVGR